VRYFPSARHERLHWLNPEGIKDEPLFYFVQNRAKRLYKPVIVESAAQENKQWLLDVMLDSTVEVQPYVEGNPPEFRFLITSNTANDLLLRQSRTNVQTLLKRVLQDDSAELRLNYRTVSPYRLDVQMNDDRLIPSLDHLSSGQANLFNLFATVMRYADRGDIKKSFQLHEIGGIVLVDEIEAQAHSDFQYEVPPKLLRLFPKVQFSSRLTRPFSFWAWRGSTAARASRLSTCRADR
jgi:hypothetical protein